MPLTFDIRGPAPVVHSVVKFQSGFFDRAKVIKSLKPRERAVMSKFGAFVRTKAQSSMLRHVVRRGFGVKSKVTNREGVSAPGEPPYVHDGALVKFLFFAYDGETHSVVVGPAATNQKFFDNNRRPVTGTVPGILERGGSITLFERQRSDGTWVRADLRSPRRLHGVPVRYRTIRIAARPYMKPAMLAELPKFLPLFERLGLSTRSE